MTEIVLFHHVRGLTDGVRVFAERLRRCGHTVHTPDTFGGLTFTTIDEGLDHVRSIGFKTVIDRGVAACAELPRELVFGGFSLGVMPAQQLLQTWPGALGGLFFSGFVDPAELDGSWPEGVPVQVHAMDQDPFFVDEGDLEAARAVQSSHPNLEIVLYPGQGHLFADSTSPDHDPGMAELLIERADAFLRAVAPSNR